MATVAELKERARALEQEGEHAKALKVYRHLLAHLEGTPGIVKELSLYVKAGDLYLKSGDPDRAASMYERAARRYAEHGSSKSVLALCGKLMRVSPSHSGAYAQFARQCLDHNHITAARDVIAKYVELAKQRGALQLLERVAGKPEAEVLPVVEKVLSAVERAEEAKTARAAAAATPVAAPEPAAPEPPEPMVPEPVHLAEPPAPPPAPAPPPPPAPAPVDDLQILHVEPTPEPDFAVQHAPEFDSSSPPVEPGHTPREPEELLDLDTLAAETPSLATQPSGDMFSTLGSERDEPELPAGAEEMPPRYADALAQALDVEPSEHEPPLRQPDTPARAPAFEPSATGAGQHKPIEIHRASTARAKPGKSRRGLMLVAGLVVVVGAAAALVVTGVIPLGGGGGGAGGPTAAPPPPAQVPAPDQGLAAGDSAALQQADTGTVAPDSGAVAFGTDSGPVLSVADSANVAVAPSAADSVAERFDSVIAPVTAPQPAADSAQVMQLPPPTPVVIPPDTAQPPAGPPSAPAPAPGGPLVVAVEGLPIERVDQISSGGREGYEITQLLASGERLILTTLPFGSDPADTAGTSQVRVRAVPPDSADGTVRFGGYLVRARARVSAGELENLLRRLVERRQ
ncbi:MAG TPA: tetratricopeptide repeat protein [Gemmatimonadales bacterium]